MRLNLVYGHRYQGKSRDINTNGTPLIKHCFNVLETKIYLKLVSLSESSYNVLHSYFKLVLFSSAVNSAVKQQLRQISPPVGRKKKPNLWSIQSEKKSYCVDSKECRLPKAKY